MKLIITELKNASIDLFPSQKEQRMVLGIISIAVFISISELLLAHFFSLLILPNNPRETRELLLLGSLFLILFTTLRLVNFVKEHFRLNIFEKSLDQNVGSNRASNSWKWATAMEWTSLLTMVGRLIFISALLFFFSPVFGLCNLIMGVCVLQTLSYRFRKQFDSQREFRNKQFSKIPVSNSEKIRTRIIAGEIGALISSVGLIFLLGVLLFLYANGNINAARAFVLFIAVRMIGQIYSGFSSGLMRFARARVLSE